MNTFTQAPSELRLRMIEDMRMRKLELRTREAYVRAVRKLAKYLGRAPDTATAEELRNFQLHRKRSIDTAIADGGGDEVKGRPIGDSLPSSRAGWLRSRRRFGQWGVC